MLLGRKRLLEATFVNERGDYIRQVFFFGVMIEEGADLMAYFNPQIYDKSFDMEDKLVLLYKLALAALISANGPEEAMRIMERMGVDKICDITEVRKVFTQVKDALGITKTVDESVLANKESEKEMQQVINEVTKTLGGAK
jgi:hypothetical protein